MNKEAKILYLNKLYESLSEDIIFLKTLLNKLIENIAIEEKDKINNLLNAYINEREKIIVYLSRFGEEISEEKDNIKEVYEEYFKNKKIIHIANYIYKHYYDDLLKIRGILEGFEKETNNLVESFSRLTPIERMSFYQINMDYLDSK